MAGGTEAARHRSPWRPLPAWARSARATTIPSVRPGPSTPIATDRDRRGRRLCGARAAGAGTGTRRDRLRRGRGYGRNADAYHITAPSPEVPAPPSACSSLDDAAMEPSAIGHVNARHVDAAERRRRSRSRPQGLRRRPTGGDLDQGRDRAPDRRGGRGGGGRRCQPATASSRRPQPRARRRRHRARRGGWFSTRGRQTPAISNSFGFGGHNASLVLTAAD